MKMHKSITAKRVAAAVKRYQRELANPGFCIECGKEAEGCEPDMRKGLCEHCGERAVYAAEELMMEFA